MDTRNPLTADQVVQRPEWEEYIFLLGNIVLQDQSPAALLKARDKIYDLLSNCIPADVLMKVGESA